MSCQGTWADGVIIQVVADVFNLRILIIESHPDFAGTTGVEGVTAPAQEQCAIFIGHVDEFNYVSTERLTSSSSIFQQQNKQNQ